MLVYRPRFSWSFSRLIQITKIRVFHLGQVAPVSSQSFCECVRWQRIRVPFLGRSAWCIHLGLAQAQLSMGWDRSGQCAACQHCSVVSFLGPVPCLIYRVCSCPLQTNQMLTSIITEELVAEGLKA